MPRMVRKPFWSASPVTIPGSAIGRMISSETTLRPKKRVRRSAIAASVPSTSAIAVAQQRDLEAGQQRVARALAVRRRARHQWSVKPGGGQRERTGHC